MITTAIFEPAFEHQNSDGGGQCVRRRDRRDAEDSASEQADRAV